MPVLGWILSAFLALAGLSALLLALLHVRYRAAWSGEWGGPAPRREGEVRIEYGFPGFMRAWEWNPDGIDPSVRRAPGVGRFSEDKPDTKPAASSAQRPFGREETPYARRPAPDDFVREEPPREESTSTVPDPGIARAESPAKKDPDRWRKALFRLATDGAAWAHLARYGLRALRPALRLLRPRVAMAAGHPDPALLGRMAGHWHAASPLLPLGDTALGFRFQDRHPSLRVRAEGGFSALSLLFFGMGLLWRFPWLALGRRARHGWRRRELTGWRAWTYRKLQSL